MAKKNVTRDRKELGNIVALLPLNAGFI